MGFGIDVIIILLVKVCMIHDVKCKVKAKCKSRLENGVYESKPCERVEENANEK